MKWFKHMTNSRDDEKISALEDMHGLVGYGFYFKILEIVATNYKGEGIPSASFSERGWARLARVSVQRFRNIIKSMQSLGLVQTECSASVLKVQAKRNEVVLKVSVPNLLKIKDNYSKDLEVTSKSLPSPNKEEEEEVYKKIDKKNGDKKDFESFWKLYPKKKSKGQAWKAWQKVPSGKLGQIMATLANAVQSKDWQEQQGKFIPYPATWLNGEGWEDVYDTPDLPKTHEYNVISLAEQTAIHDAKLAAEGRLRREKTC